MATETLPTYYDVLQVERDATPERVRTAYRKLAQKYHPDKMPDNANAVRAMAAINAAYEVLSDGHRRAEHDLWIRRATHTSKPVPAAPQAPDTLWALLHPVTHWAWYLLGGTFLFVMGTLVTAIYLAAMPVRPGIKAEPCKLSAPAASARCANR